MNPKYSNKEKAIRNMYSIPDNQNLAWDQEADIRRGEE